jgi:phage terminase large subunit GpA-like protein
MNYTDSFIAGIRPDPLVSVSEWANANRVLSQTASSEPGRWRTDRTPYLREIMDCLSPSNQTEKVVFMKGAQIGGTEAGNNWVGYIIDQAPGPLLVVQPTVEMGKRWSKGRLAPLIEDTPCLRGKIKDPRSRDSGNTVQSKEFRGGIVVVTGANSAVGLRSMPVRYLFLDEVDAYPGDADGEGDPVSLAIQRTATFARRKILLVSTPTIQGISRIEMEYENSDQRQFHVPCPHCNELQVLTWPQIQFDDERGAFYKCISCSKKIEEFEKTEMLQRGQWIAKIPSRTVAGFHISSLYSPVGWFSWQQAVTNFKQAQKNETLLKVWVNTTLGEPWVDRGEAPDWERLYERSEDYPRGIIPKGGLILTAGVDVQKDRLECEIVAWGLGKESWSVDYVVIPSPPSSSDAWQRLKNLLDTTFQLQDSDDALPISMMAVDAGYATQEVYNWVRQQSPYRVMAVKGVDKALVPLGSPSRVEVNIGGRKLSRGVKLWPVGVSILKSELYAWLRQSKTEVESEHTETEFWEGASKRSPGAYSNVREDASIEATLPKTVSVRSAAGYAHFPKYNPEYFKQLTAEQLVTKTVKGYAKREWQKLRERNEALDCRIYARAAALALGMDRWLSKHWAQLQKRPQNKTKLAVSITASNEIEKLETKIDPIITTQNTIQRQRIVRSAWLNR